MGLLRSEKMGYYELVMQSDMAWRTLNEIGKLSAVQVVDLNSDQTVFNRTYASYIRRCEEAERRIRFIMQEQDRFNISVVTTQNAKEVIDEIDEGLESSKLPAQTYFENLERDLESYEDKISTQAKNYEQMVSNSTALRERKIVLEKAKESYGNQQQQQLQMFSRIAGVIERVDIERFKRMIFRVTRGNALSVFYDIQELMYDQKSDKHVEKSVFFILYQGEEGGLLWTKLGRVCDTLGINRYAIPVDFYQIDRDYNTVLDEIRVNEEINNKTKENIQSILQKLAGVKSSHSLCSLIEEYRLFVLKEKAIYHYLNMFQLRNNFFYGNCWCPKNLESKVRSILDDFARHPGFASGHFREVDGPLPPGTSPPSYFKLNEFTSAFQEIVDTYGVPNYQEANPALFTIVTFPYLFGIMFGDVGHGMILFLFASWLCLSKESIQKSGSMFQPAIPARYLLLMMGLFATYNGLIYNDFLGIPFNFFGSKWAENNNDTYVASETYPFGMDPVWYTSENELIFFNSFKMKISVIFGVTQMIIGILFKGLNSLYFRSAVDFFFEFIPQLLFMSCIFGYMIIMIFIKWSIDWNYNWNDTAPNLISVLMNMFLKGGKLDDQLPLWGNAEEQENLQLLLLVIAGICVPLMLFPKPLINMAIHSARSRSGAVFQNLDDHPKTEHFDFSEEFIHQMIETIEYVLGAVSNTASYLRLWALSLAHAQLSKVFFDKCLVGTIESGNPVLVVVGFFVFANVTVGVLMCMDAMECFLHALRLHWVEFQSKFYKGQGTKFVPFSFVTVATEGRVK